MQAERRQFFRVEDLVSLNTEFIADSDVAERIEQFFSDQHRASIRNNFNYEIEQHQGDLQHIKERMPEVGRYLVFLQQQINLLTERLVDDAEQFEQTDIPAVLSAQGIAYQSNQCASIGSYIELRLKLNPAGQEVASIARVVNCSPIEDSVDRFQLALDFEHIHEADREIIVKHVHARQISQLASDKD